MTKRNIVTIQYWPGDISAGRAPSWSVAAEILRKMREIQNPKHEDRNPKQVQIAREAEGLKHGVQNAAAGFGL